MSSEWYDLNKEIYNETRKQRYHTDLSYRDSVKFKNNTYKYSTRGILKPKEPVTITININGVVYSNTLYPLYAVIKELSISKQRFDSFIEKHIFPSTPFYDSNNVSYFTEDSLELMRVVLENKR